jgi:hypothetical protein
MATRSTIARKTATGIESIYCHWDGYPDGVGATLRSHYVNEEKITQLMTLGNLSVLGEEIGTQKDFDTSVLNNECLAYGRDRGETGQASLSHETFIDWVNTRRGNGCQYGYIWNGATWEIVDLD